MNLDKLDRIVLRNEDEVNRLFAWKDANKDLVRDSEHGLKEGVIQYGSFVCWFKEDGARIEYIVWVKDVKILTLTIERIKGSYKPVSVWQLDGFGRTKEENMADTVTLHWALMAYMQHHVEYVSKRKERVASSKPARHKSNNKKRVAKLGRVVYDVSVSEKNILDIESKKREYHRKVESFPVRGHYRHYKTGMVKWIEGYKKGEKTKQAEPKEYKM